MTSSSISVPSAPNSSPTKSPSEECCPFQRISVQDQAVLGPYKTCDSCDRFLGFIEPEPGTLAYEKRKGSLLDPITVQTSTPEPSIQPAPAEPLHPSLPPGPIPRLSVSQATPPPNQQRRPRPRSRTRQGRYHPYPPVNQFPHAFTPVDTTKSITWSHLPLPSCTHFRAQRPPPPPPVWQPPVSRSINREIQSAPAARPMEPQTNTRLGASFPQGVNRGDSEMGNEALYGQGRIPDPRFLHPDWEAALSRQRQTRRREMIAYQQRQQQQHYIAQHAPGRRQGDSTHASSVFHMPSRPHFDFIDPQLSTRTHASGPHTIHRSSHDPAITNIDPRLQAHVSPHQIHHTEKRAFRSPASAAISNKVDVDMTTASDVPASMSEHPQFLPLPASPSGIETDIGTRMPSQQEGHGHGEVIIIDDDNHNNNNKMGHALPAPFCPCGVPARGVMVGSEAEGRGRWKWVCGTGRCGYYMDV